APLLGLDCGYRRAGEGWWGGLTTYPLAVLLLVVLTPPQVAAGGWVVLATVDPVAAAASAALPGRPSGSMRSAHAPKAKCTRRRLRSVAL
ncbi:MAG: hypothetical protein ACYS6Z_18105, partial [Planctomycetota bacterium]